MESQIKIDDAALKQNETIQILEETARRSQEEITELQARVVQLSEERDDLQRSVGPAFDLKDAFADVVGQKKSLEFAVADLQREKEKLKEQLQAKKAAAKKRFDAAMQAERARAQDEVALLNKRIDDYKSALSGRKVRESPAVGEQAKRVIQTLRFEKEFLARFARTEVEDDGAKFRPLIASVMFLLQLNLLVPGRRI